MIGPHGNFPIRAAVVISTLSNFLLASLSTATLLADEGSESEALGRLNEAYVAAFNGQDSQKLDDLFVPDADYVILTGDLLATRAAIVQGHQSFFLSNPRAKLEGKQLQRRFLKPDLVLSHGQWMIKNGPSEFPNSGLWDAVAIKENGQWRYAAIRLSVPVQAKPK